MALKQSMIADSILFVNPNMWGTGGKSEMATDNDTKGIRELLTALASMHAWQGQLLAEAMQLLTSPADVAPKKAGGRPASRPRRPRGRGNKGGRAGVPSE